MREPVGCRRRRGGTGGGDPGAVVPAGWRRRRTRTQIERRCRRLPMGDGGGRVPDLPLGDRKWPRKWNEVAMAARWHGGKPAAWWCGALNSGGPTSVGALVRSARYGAGGVAGTGGSRRADSGNGGSGGPGGSRRYRRNWRKRRHSASAAAGVIRQAGGQRRHGRRRWARRSGGAAAAARGVEPRWPGQRWNCGWWWAVSLPIGGSGGNATTPSGGAGGNEHLEPTGKWWQESWKDPELG